METSRTVVITGGTGGLGHRPGPPARRQGKHRLAVTYLIPDEAEAFERQVELEEDRMLLRRVDANDAEEVAAFFKAAAEQFGSIDALCSLVGGWAGARDVEETDDVRFERMLDLNLRSAFYRGSGRYPLSPPGRIGSHRADGKPGGSRTRRQARSPSTSPRPGSSPWPRRRRQELDGTTSPPMCLLPTVIDTPATRAALPFADYVYWPTPDEIASVIEFLLSPGSQVINGADIPVYGHT